MYPPSDRVRSAVTSAAPSSLRAAAFFLSAASVVLRCFFVSVPLSCCTTRPNREPNKERARIINTCHTSPCLTAHGCGTLESSSICEIAPSGISSRGCCQPASQPTGIIRSQQQNRPRHSALSALSSVGESQGVHLSISNEKLVTISNEL